MPATRATRARLRLRLTRSGARRERRRDRTLPAAAEPAAPAAAPAPATPAAARPSRSPSPALFARTRLSSRLPPRRRSRPASAASTTRAGSSSPWVRRSARSAPTPAPRRRRWPTSAASTTSWPRACTCSISGSCTPTCQSRRRPKRSGSCARRLPRLESLVTSPRWPARSTRSTQRLLPAGRPMRRREPQPRSQPPKRGQPLLPRPSRSAGSLNTRSNGSQRRTDARAAR